MHRPAGSKIGCWLRSGSGYLLFAAVHYELDGDGRVECEGCTYTHDMYLHLPPLLQSTSCRVRLPPEYPSVIYCVKKPFGMVQQFAPLSTSMPSLSLVTMPPSETTTTLNPPSPIPNKMNIDNKHAQPGLGITTSYPFNSPIMPLIDTTSSPSLSINGTKETSAGRTCCSR